MARKHPQEREGEVEGEGEKEKGIGERERERWTDRLSCHAEVMLSVGGH